MKFTTPVDSEFPSLALQQLEGHMSFWLFPITYVLLALDFHELWHRVMTICLLTEVKRQWAMLVLGWVTVSV